MADHKCHPPMLAFSAGTGTAIVQPDWTCQECGRMWRDCLMSNGLRWWAEIVGPGSQEQANV